VGARPRKDLACFPSAAVLSAEQRRAGRRLVPSWPGLAWGSARRPSLVAAASCPCWVRAGPGWPSDRTCLGPAPDLPEVEAQGSNAQPAVHKKANGMNAVSTSHLRPSCPAGNEARLGKRDEPIWSARICCQ